MGQRDVSPKREGAGRGLVAALLSCIAVDTVALLVWYASVPAPDIYQGAETRQGTGTETRRIIAPGAAGEILGEAVFSYEDGYYTMARNDDVTIAYDSSCLDEVFEEGRSDVTLESLDAAIDANPDIPDDFKPIAHAYCAALVSRYPSADLRVLHHNLERLSVAFESGEQIKEEAGDEIAGAYFDWEDHRIVLPRGVSFARGSWGLEAAYHELGHATRLYYGEDGDGGAVYVLFSGPDDQTDAISEALNTLFARSLLDEGERTDTPSYELQCDYATILLDSLDGYGLGDYLDHSSQWLTRMLDERLGADEGQILLELMQLQKDDLSDGRADIDAPALSHLDEDLRELGYAGELPTEDAAGTPAAGTDTDPDGGGQASGSAVPEGVSYLAPFTETPQATYRVLAYGGSAGGTPAGEDRDAKAEANGELAREAQGGGGQYVAFYQDGTCRLFKTADGLTADVEIGYWDADADSGIRNYTLAYAYYDDGVLSGADGLMFAKGSSGTTMLLEPCDVDVRGLAPYRTAQRWRDEDYEQHHALEGGWTVESVRAAEAADADALLGGCEGLYVKGFFLCRVGADGESNVLDGHLEVSSLTRATYEGDGPERTFELVGADTLVERVGDVEVTYRRDASVSDPWD